MNIYLCIAILEGQVIALAIVFLGILLKLSDMEDEAKREASIERNWYLAEHFAGGLQGTNWDKIKKLK